MLCKKRESKTAKTALSLAHSSGLSSDSFMLLKHDGLRIDSHTLGGVVSFVDADKTISDLEHVVPQGDDDELSILCLLLHRDEWKRKNNTDQTGKKTVFNILKE